MAKRQFIVGHPNQYLKVKGKLAHVKKGTEVTMDEKHAASLVKQGKLLVKGQEEKVDIGGDEKADEK